MMPEIPIHLQLKTTLDRVKQLEKIFKHTFETPVGKEFPDDRFCKKCNLYMSDAIHKRAEE
jgi:hypothetical protein